eukprot:2682866-Pyramimonas_sp.AAC.1
MRPVVPPVPGPVVGVAPVSRRPPLLPPFPPPPLSLSSSVPPSYTLCSPAWRLEHGCTAPCTHPWCSGEDSRSQCGHSPKAGHWGEWCDSWPETNLGVPRHSLIR